jgi:hypothetical protein
MKKIIFAFVLLFTLLSFNAIKTTVFICNGPKAAVYHKSSECRGLNRCSTNISSVSEEKAIQMGRRKCKIEY